MPLQNFSLLMKLLLLYCREAEAKRAELDELKDQRAQLESALVKENQRQDDLKKKVSALRKRKEKLNIIGNRLKNKYRYESFHKSSIVRSGSPKRCRSE